MRLAFIAPLAVAAAVGVAAPAAACSLDGATGPIGGVITSIGGALGLTSRPAAPTTTASTCGGGSTPGAGSTSSGCANGTAGAGLAGAGSVTNNFITNNFITNNNTTGDGTQGTTGTTPTGQTLPLTFPAGASAGGGGGAGGGGFGGFSGGGNAISGTPINPSSDLGPILAGGQANGGGGGAGEPIMLASVGGGETGGASPFAAVASMPDEGPAMTPGVTVASLPAVDQGSGNSESFIGMALPKTGETQIASASEFGLDGPPAVSGTPPSNGTFMLAGLIGVAVMGAGWAWKSALM